MRVNFGKKIIFISLAFLVVLSGYTANYDYSFTDEDRDPFYPLISQKGQVLIPREVSVANLFLRGIIYSKDSPLAIVNDEILKEKDLIGEYRIEKIEKKRVILKKGSEKVILKLVRLLPQNQ